MGALLRAQRGHEDREELVGPHAQASTHHRSSLCRDRCRNTVVNDPDPLRPVAELEQLWNLNLADDDRPVHARRDESVEGFSVDSRRRAWPEMLVRQMGRSCPPGDQVTDDMSVDALRDSEVRLERRESKRSPQPAHVEAVSHVGAGRGYATASELVEERPFADERQDGDVELRAERRDEV